MANITKELAKAIAKKLKAKMHPGTNHDFAKVFHKGKLVAMFGIKRGSKKDSRHDYVSSQIYLHAREARLLGQCPFSRDDWLEVMLEKGKL